MKILYLLFFFFLLILSIVNAVKIDTGNFIFNGYPNENKSFYFNISNNDDKDRTFNLDLQNDINISCSFNNNLTQKSYTLVKNTETQESFTARINSGAGIGVYRCKLNIDYEIPEPQSEKQRETWGGGGSSGGSSNSNITKPTNETKSEEEVSPVEQPKEESKQEIPKDNTKKEPKTSLNLKERWLKYKWWIISGIVIILGIIGFAYLFKNYEFGNKGGSNEQKRISPNE